MRGDGVFANFSHPLSLPLGTELRTGEDEHLEIQSGPVSNAGRIEALGNSFQGAEMEFSAALTNVAGTGSIVGHDSIFRFRDGVTNYGGMAFGSGLNDILGDITNESGGSISISGGATAIFHEDVQNNSIINVSAAGGLQSSAIFFGTLSGNGILGSGNVFIEGDARPGFSPGVMQFGGDLTYGPLATLEIELGGITPGTEHDQISVTGEINLGGSLQVTLINGFVPSAGMTFDLWNAAYVTGQFHTVTLPNLPGGLFWHTSDLNTTGEIHVGLTPETYAGFASFYGLTGSPSDDDDGDGIANLHEYVMAKNPLVNDFSHEDTGFEISGGDDTFSFILAQPLGSDITLEIENSSTLKSTGPGAWSQISSRAGNSPWSGTPVTIAPHGSGLEKITLSVPTTGDRNFYRLKITLIPSP